MPESEYTISALQTSLAFFLPAWLPDDTKEKVVNACRADFAKTQCYDLQMRATGVAKQIESSRILGINDVIIPIIIKEYAELYLCCEAVLKQIAGMKKYLPIDRVTDGIKLKKFNDWLYNDLSKIQVFYGIDVQIANCMRYFKLLIDADVIVLVGTDWRTKGFLQNNVSHAPLVNV